MSTSIQGLRDAADFIRQASGVDPAFLREAAEEIEKFRSQLEYAEYEWNRATEGMKERDAEIERLRREVAEWKQAASVEAGLRREFYEQLEYAEKTNQKLFSDYVDVRSQFETAHRNFDAEKAEIVGKLFDQINENKSLRSQLVTARAAFMRIDAINDNPARYDKEIDDLCRPFVALMGADRNRN